MKRYSVLLIFLVCVLALPSVTALSFSAGPIISSDNITTTNDFACDFTPLGTGSLTANITWYIDGSSWTSDDQSVVVSSGSSFSSNLVSHTDTTKHEMWKCEVTLDNSSDIFTSNSSEVEIKNTLPTINDPTQVIFYEDSYYGFVMTALDPDGDAFSWTSNDQSKGNYGGVELFDILSNGTVIIQETTEDLVGLHRMQLIAEDDPDDDFAGKYINFTLLAVNDAPIFSNLSLSYQCNETEVCSGSIVATDEDNSSNELTYQFNESFINWSSDGSFYFIPTYNQAVIENWTIEVNVTDGINTTLEFLNLTIFTTNHEPNVSYVDVSGVQNDSLYTFYFNVTDLLDPQDVFFFSIVDDCGKNVWTIQNLTNGSSSTTALGLINTSLYSNDYVECRDVTISVLEYEDTFMTLKRTYDYPLTLNITNINDAPVINELSSLNIRENISDQIAAIFLSFTYFVNATDVDALTYQGDSLFYWLSGDPAFDGGAPMFVIDSSTGNITAVQSEMNSTYAGVWEFTVNVNDSLTPTLFDSRNMTLNISYNFPPIINTFNSSSCAENFSCLKNISADDFEFSESFLSVNSLNYTNPLNASRTNYTGDEISSLLGLNTSAGEFSTTTTSYWINFTPDDEHVGYYALNLTFSDDVGNTNTTVLYFNITNTPEAPDFDNDADHTILEHVSFGIVAETLPFLKHIFFYDPDLLFNLDNLNFSFVFDGPALPSFNISQVNNSCALINYTVDSVSSGSYTINITLNDSYNFSTTQVVNFDVHDTTEFPNITQVKPFLNESSNLTDTSFFNIFENTSTIVEFDEGNTVTFDIRVFDGDNDSMNVSWYFDGSLVQDNIYNASNLGSSSYEKTFSFFENGTYNITVHVQDIGYDEFTWFVNVNDFNRPPVLAHDLDNMTGNSAIRGSSTVFYSNFFKLYWDAKIVFYDPDDDLNSDGEIGSGEVNNLVFTVNNSGGCDELATFAFDDNSDNVTIKPVTTGTCSTAFVAVDPYNRSVNSNEVALEIIKIQSDSGSSSSGSTTITRTETITIPYEEEVDVPESFKLLYPGTTTIYENGTVSIPIILKNDWTDDLSSITLSVNDSRNNLTYYFSNNFIANLPKGTSLNESLTLVGYQLDGPFEFNVTAEIDSIKYNDTATIYVNALERGKEDIESLKSRIGYARDLLSDSPVCAELMEILDQAEKDIATVPMETINGVINGCKYLMGEIEAPNNSFPKSFTGRLSLYGKTIIDYNLLFIILGALVAAAIIISVVAKFTLKKI